MGNYRFVGCDATKTQKSNTGINNAFSMLTTTFNYFRAGTSCDAPYVRWFGSDRSLRSTVLGVFTNVNARLNSNLVIDCAAPSCQSTWYAFVYATDSTYTVHLCGAYWNAADGAQEGSKPGTIIHELTHFKSVGGTGDSGYGAAYCERLAKSSPSMAARNADNYAMFVEYPPRC